MVDFVKLKEDKEKPKKRSRLNWKGILLLFIFLFFLSSIISSITYSISPKIAVIPVKGIIATESSSSLSGDTISSREIANILRTVEADDSIKAVIIDIDSPGGSPVASEEISKAIEKVKEKKPVYALVNNLGASGGFWVAVSANKTYASSMSILGSIGVTSATLGFEDLIKELNISYRRQVAGEFKDLGSPFREVKEGEKEIIQELLDEIHKSFIEHVSKSRNLEIEEVEKVATGEVFLGNKAKELKLIDEIGYYPDVLRELRNMTSEDAIIVDYGPEPSLVETLGLKNDFKLSTGSLIELR